MIIISSSLILSPPEPLNTPIFGWNNLVANGEVTATSEADEYPASNLVTPSTALRWRAAEEGSPAGPPSSDQYLTVSELDGMGEVCT